MPGVDIMINNYDLEQTFGICLEEGGLDAFEVPAAPKEPFYNEWFEEPGKDYDQSAPFVLSPRTIDIPFLIKADTMEGFRLKKRQFLELISINGEFSFQILEWGEAFKLRYKEIVEWSFINVGIDSETSARFVLRAEDNHGVSQQFAYLVDGGLRYFIINKNQRILVRTSYE